MFDAVDPDAIACICNKCNKGNMNKFLKNINYKKVKEAIDKSKADIKLTEDGEII
jgi:hypothetical protein